MLKIFNVDRRLVKAAASFLALTATPHLFADCRQTLARLFAQERIDALVNSGTTNFPPIPRNPLRCNEARWIDTRNALFLQNPDQAPAVRVSGKHEFTGIGSLNELLSKTLVVESYNIGVVSGRSVSDADLTWFRNTHQQIAAAFTGNQWQNFMNWSLNLMDDIYFLYGTNLAAAHPNGLPADATAAAAAKQTHIFEAMMQVLVHRGIEAGFPSTWLLVPNGLRTVGPMVRVRPRNAANEMVGLREPSSDETARGWRIMLGAGRLFIDEIFASINTPEIPHTEFAHLLQLIYLQDRLSSLGYPRGYVSRVIMPRFYGTESLGTLSSLEYRAGDTRLPFNNGARFLLNWLQLQDASETVPGSPESIGSWILTLLRGYGQADMNGMPEIPFDRISSQAWGTFLPFGASGGRPLATVNPARLRHIAVFNVLFRNNDPSHPLYEDWMDSPVPPDIYSHTNENIGRAILWPRTNTGYNTNVP